MNLSEQWMMNCGYNGGGIKGCKGAGSADYFKYLIGVKPNVVHENTLGYLAMDVSTRLLGFYFTFTLSQSLLNSNYSLAKSRQNVTQ